MSECIHSEFILDLMLLPVRIQILMFWGEKEWFLFRLISNEDFNCFLKWQEFNRMDENYYSDLLISCFLVKSYHAPLVWPFIYCVTSFRAKFFLCNFYLFWRNKKIIIKFPRCILLKFFLFNSTISRYRFNVSDNCYVIHNHLLYQSQHSGCHIRTS